MPLPQEAGCHGSLEPLLGVPALHSATLLSFPKATVGHPHAVFTFCYQVDCSSNQPHSPRGRMLCSVGRSFLCKMGICKEVEEMRFDFPSVSKVEQ